MRSRAHKILSLLPKIGASSDVEEDEGEPDQPESTITELADAIEADVRSVLEDFEVHDTSQEPRSLPFNELQLVLLQIEEADGENELLTSIHTPPSTVTDTPSSTSTKQIPIIRPPTTNYNPNRKLIRQPFT